VNARLESLSKGKKGGELKKERRTEGRTTHRRLKGDLVTVLIEDLSNHGHSFACEFVHHGTIDTRCCTKLVARKEGRKERKRGIKEGRKGRKPYKKI
jgi:hypothetical protein